MKIGTDASLLSPTRYLARLGVKVGAGAAMLGLVAYSAVIAKEARSAPLLASVRAVQPQPAPDVLPERLPVIEVAAPALIETTAVFTESPASLEVEPAPVEQEPVEVVEPEAPAVDPLSTDPNVRWFNGRPVRPVKVITMTVTAYSPDSRSCGDSADGITATLHSVETNGFRLVAADPAILPYGSMITVPGYDHDTVVPVLDCGGAIKGRRLDVLFPTHKAAREWGVRKVPVTVWGYVDGKPAENPRRER